MSDPPRPPWDQLDLAATENAFVRMLGGEHTPTVFSTATDQRATVGVCGIPDSEWALICLSERRDRPIVKLALTHATQPTLEAGSWTRRYGTGPRFHWTLAHERAVTVRSRVHASDPWTIWPAGPSGWVTSLMVLDDFAYVPVTEYRSSPGGQWDSLPTGVVP